MKKIMTNAFLCFISTFLVNCGQNTTNSEIKSDGDDSYYTDVYNTASRLGSSFVEGAAKTGKASGGIANTVPGGNYLYDGLSSGNGNYKTGAQQLQAAASQIKSIGSQGLNAAKNIGTSATSALQASKQYIAGGVGTVASVTTSAGKYAATQVGSGLASAGRGLAAVGSSTIAAGAAAIGATAFAGYGIKRVVDQSPGNDGFTPVAGYWENFDDLYGGLYGH